MATVVTRSIVRYHNDFTEVEHSNHYRLKWNGINRSNKYSIIFSCPPPCSVLQWGFSNGWFHMFPIVANLSTHTTHCRPNGP